jgi:competence protein ComFC
MQGIAKASPLGWLEAALGFVYPNICQICRSERAVASEGFVCGQCRCRSGAVQMVVTPFCNRCGLPFAGAITHEFECSNCRGRHWHFEYARAAAAARGLVLEVIHRFKYSGAIWFEPFLAGLLVSVAAPVLAREGWDLIVPVPLHPVKEREREFNQAEKIARRLAKAAGVPMERGLLRRVAPTRTQTLLSRAERAANVARAFAMGRGKRLEGERIVLVDDVFTTGATTNACAKVLRANGSGQVCVWTVARGL